MGSKRSYNKIGGGETEQSEEGQSPEKINYPSDNSSSSCQQEVEMFPEGGNTMPNVASPEAGKKGNDAGHGNRFQSKLLILYAVRAINFGYQFYLGTELSVGEKFDDLIFHYKDQNDITLRQQYLQVKHRLNENNSKKQITENDLLDENDGDFSLLKYFQSFVKIRSKGNDIEHCTICTNVDFDHKNIKEKGITLDWVDELTWPKLLHCKDIKNDQACYKLKDPGIFKTTLFENILNCLTNCTGEEMKSLFQNCTEVVNGKPFNDLKADEMTIFFTNSQQNQNQVIQKLVEIVFDDFLEKVIFAVKMPNESELNNVLTKAVGDYFKLTNSMLQSANFMNEMVNWFKLLDEKHDWLTPRKAKEILKANAAHIKVIKIPSFSLDYQKQLKRIKTSENVELEFEDTVIDEWTAMLQLFWDSQEKIKHVSTKAAKLTAVKVFSAIKKLFPFKDDYLVISSKLLKENQTEIKELLIANININGFLVVVDEDAKNPIEDDLFYEKFIPENAFEESKKKVIVISNQSGSKESYQDTITYEQLNENTKKMLEDKQVSFQGNDFTVNALINMKQANEADKILDLQLIENLLQMAELDNIVIPSFNTSSFGKQIERKLKFPSKDQLFKKLADIEENPDQKIKRILKTESKKINEEIEIDQNGNIKWKTKNDRRKKEILKKISVLLEQNNSLYFHFDTRKSLDLSLLSTVNERELIDGSNKRIIITDVAGTGKSTILSTIYDEIKRVNPDYLVINISLMNHSKALTNEKNINEFLINNVMGQNTFARLLMEHRLRTGDRIIFMLDGFDEIETECQNKVVELVKTLNESIPLYITTRPHLVNKLQFELSQLAYRLDKFTKEDQINYLTSIWEEYLKDDKVAINDKKIETFARQIIDRVNNTLKDKEKEYIGIPLQCRILAECFQSKIKDEIIQKPNADLSHLIGGQQFDLVHLYKSLIDEKRRVFRQEKIEEYSRKDHVANDSIENIINKTERHLRKLAIQIIENKQEDVDILIPSAGFQSESERKTEEKQLNEFGIRFGLVDANGENGIQFQHRTFAEYLVADFVFNGFLLDKEKHSDLLENESARKWIIEEILMKDNYEGVRVFFDSMLKEIILKEEWKSRIQNNQLSSRLQQLFASFISKKRTPVLKIAFREMNSNISLLIFDCLDVTLRKTPSEILSVIEHSLDSLGIVIRKPFSIFRQRIDVFDRFFNYFDNSVNYPIMCRLTDELKMKKQQIENKKLERFLFFVDRHVHKKWDFFHLTVFFVRSKVEEQTMKQFFKILMSKEDLDLTQLMKDAIKENLDQYDCQIGKIDKALTILRDLGLINVAIELSRLVIFRGHEIIKREENTKFRLSLRKMGMIGLHEAAFEGDLSLIENEIGCSLENPEICSEEERKSVVQLMTNDEDLVPPLYLAAAYGHDDICKKIFRFLDLKKEISDNKGFFHRSLEDATECENIIMIQTILKCAKEIYGGNDLVKLLQSVVCYINIYLSKMQVEKIIDIFMQDTENGCKELNDWIFYDYLTLEILEYVECDVLQKLIAAAGGFDNWIIRLIDTDLRKAFGVLLSNGFLDQLNQANQIPKLIDILITKSTLDDNKPSEPSTSYWSDYVNKKPSLFCDIEKFLAAISKCASEEDLKRLLLSRDGNNVVILLKFFIRNGKPKSNFIFTDLPENLRKEFEDLSEEEKPKLIEHFFSTPTFLESLNENEQLNAIEYYLENGNENQLEKFSQVVKVHQLKKVFMKSWNEEKGKKIAGLLKEKLDSQTVVKYNKFIEKYLKQLDENSSKNYDEILRGVLYREIHSMQKLSEKFNKAKGGHSNY